MKKELLISKMAILLFFYVFLFGATVQAQQGECFLYYNPTDCTLDPGCHWCATSMKCIPLASVCPTCGQVEMDDCKSSSSCHWCVDQYICFPMERPCTCGNKIVEPPEQCDGGANCNNCYCPQGMIADGKTPPGCMTPPVPPVCGNGILEAGEECEPIFGRNCDPVTCMCANGYDPDPDYPGYCKATAVCGDGILQEGEQCEIFSRNCVNCLCVDGTIPDPINIGFCIYPIVCGNGILQEGEECDSTPNCGVDCKCISPYEPDPQNPGVCKAVAVCGDGKVEPGEECDSTANCDTECKCLEYYPTSQGYCAVDVKVAVGDAVGEIPAFNVKSKGKFTVRFTGTTAPVLDPAITMTTSDLYNKNTYVYPLFYQWDVNGDLVLQYSRQQMVQVLKLDQYTKKEVVRLVFGCWADNNHFELIGMIKIVNK